MAYVPSMAMKVEGTKGEGQHENIRTNERPLFLVYDTQLLNFIPTEFRFLA